MKRILSICMTFALSFSTLCLYAQDVTVSGTVKDQSGGTSLAGVNIIAKGTTVGTVSDIDGNYSLTVPASADSIVFRYLGYADRAFAVNRSGGSYNLNVTLKAADVGLNQVVVSGSRRQEKILESPASISVVNEAQIENTIAVTPVDYIQEVPGVDVIKTGLVSSDVVVRGFNNIFSGALLSLVDNRIGRVPSLRVNAYQLIPSNEDDIERIEVVRGPASALYGPNASSGVMHIITKSPLDMDEKHQTKVSVAGGLERNVLTGNVRHSQKIKDNLGFKLSAKYLQGHDWTYDDPFEPDSLYLYRQTAEGNDTVDFLSHSERDNFITSYKVDGRLDYRFKKNMELILSGGFTWGDNVELTGLGAAQVVDWRYSYMQARYRWKNLFVQGFTNWSNAGDTYLLRTGGLIVDRSKLYVGQIQHSYSPISRLRFIYGVDGLFTRPDTDGTINGKNEEDDDITEVGVYLQADYDVIEKVELVGALRADYHNFVDDLFLSPRAGIVFKPTPRHTVRAMYNRAFDSPTSNNLSLDLLQAELPTGIPVRAVGNRDGYGYSFASNPFIAESPSLPQYLTPFAADSNLMTLGYSPTGYINLHDPVLNNAFWDVTTNLIADNFVDFVKSEELPYNEALVRFLVNSILPDSLSSIVQNKVKVLNLTTTEFEELDVKDIPEGYSQVENAITQTYEIGYKGILFDRLMVTVDFYRTDKKDFVSPLTLISPNVFIDEATLAADVKDEITSNVESSIAKDLLVSLLDSSDTFNGNRNGRADDEVLNIVLDAARQIPFGTITPTATDGPTMLVTYINIGDITVYGMDLGINYIVNDELRVGGAFSWVSEDTITVPGAQFGYVSLNAPKYKTAVNATYNWKKIGLSFSAQWRWQDRFLANSGAYVGPVPAFNVVDASVDYALPFSKETHITLSVNNVLGHEYQTFVGTPFLDRLTMLRVSHTF